MDARAPRGDGLRSTKCRHLFPEASNWTVCTPILPNRSKSLPLCNQEFEEHHHPQQPHTCVSAADRTARSWAAADAVAAATATPANRASPASDAAIAADDSVAFPLPALSGPEASPAAACGRDEAAVEPIGQQDDAYQPPRDWWYWSGEGQGRTAECQRRAFTPDEPMTAPDGQQWMYSQPEVGAAAHAHQCSRHRHSRCHRPRSRLRWQRRRGGRCQQLSSRSSSKVHYLCRCCRWCPAPSCKQVEAAAVQAAVAAAAVAVARAASISAAAVAK